MNVLAHVIPSQPRLLTVEALLAAAATNDEEFSVITYVRKKMFKL